ncbi:BAG family molecular chaperone regulator 5, mitochondrial [Alnus glutinosa]|uniref:BAG family molecular chaperone regulator 5, mitochondrial n=1 Tax=Alnus glutinosa TaxID=3517 RepID=UPI002D796BEE|nr:BAG family molecular chaperone regulator 5, mitochondrial [Alnus glutinosa]
MKHSRKASFFSSSSTTVTYTLHNDNSTPPPHPNSTEIPIQSSETAQIPITVHLPKPNAATKIQSAYRAHIVRSLYKKISAVNSEADQLQRLIQRQETVDAVRSNDREKLRMNEALMGLLLRLDSVPGVDPAVREARRKVSRRIVALQEILDAISEAKVGDDCCFTNHTQWGYGYYDGFMRSWDDVVAEMEEEVCRERGGDEMERFCAQHLGFRCLQRFLREP